MQVITWTVIIIFIGGCFRIYRIRVKKRDERKRKIDETINSVNDAISRFKKLMASSQEMDKRKVDK